MMSDEKTIKGNGKKHTIWDAFVENSERKEKTETKMVKKNTMVIKKIKVGL